MSAYGLSDMDRGAIAALNLLGRADEVHEGEEDWQTTASDIVAAIEREGLPATIRFQMDAETDYMVGEEDTVEELFGAFPEALAEIAKAAPHTVWREATHD